MEKDWSGQIRANIKELRAYTARHEELKAAHHFLYDLRFPKRGSPDFVVMGINPGETAHDWNTAPEPTEETSLYDFHEEAGDGRSAIRWSRAAEYFLSGADYVLAELFFWSSYDGRQFEERFGPLHKSKHLDFCTRMNRDLIEAYSPKAVVLPGLGSAPICRKLYGLSLVDAIADEKGRLVEHHTDGVRPWIFTKHWTGSYGFSTAQREIVRNAIQGSV